MASSKTRAKQKFTAVATAGDFPGGTVVKRGEPSESQALSTARFPEMKDERKAARAPLRKYIRKVGAPGQQRPLLEVVTEEKPKEITLASLKAKYGLSGTKTGTTNRNAERYGKV